MGPWMTTGPSRVLVLLSGGIDSAVALWWSLDAGHDVRALTFDYHLRPEPEKRATRALAEAADVPDLRTIDLPELREVADLEGSAPPALDGAAPSYVPHRNLIFYSLAAHHAERAGATRIVGGHNGVDPETFPDSGPAFFEGLNDLLAMGRWSATEDGLEVVNPLHGRSKREVVWLGRKLGVPFERTWSCGEHVEAPCGACASCRERAEAFEAAGLQDPGFRVP